MTCNYVSSSSISQVCYDAPAAQLEIAFHGGRAYRYSGVPKHVHAELMVAASHGKYFAQFIKDRYPTTRIR